MKKLTLILTLVILSISTQAQNIIQVTNDGSGNNNSQKKECEYKINGICSTEDIGGVDVEITCGDCSSWCTVYATFTNYNSFTVTVLYEISNNGDQGKADGSTGSIVIPANGSKQVDWGRTYACQKGNFSVRGIIVRKLKN